MNRDEALAWCVENWASWPNGRCTETNLPVGWKLYDGAEDTVFLKCGTERLIGSFDFVREQGKSSLTRNESVEPQWGGESEPPIGCKVVNDKGNEYTVLHIANRGFSLGELPTSVVYRNYDDIVLVKTLCDFKRTIKPANNDEHMIKVKECYKVMGLNWELDKTAHLDACVESLIKAGYP